RPIFLGGTRGEQLENDVRELSLVPTGPFISRSMSIHSRYVKEVWPARQRPSPGPFEVIHEHISAGIEVVAIAPVISQDRDEEIDGSAMPGGFHGFAIL